MRTALIKLYYAFTVVILLLSILVMYGVKQANIESKNNKTVSSIEEIKTDINKKIVTVVNELPEVDDHQLQCLALNIYHEARGESVNGKLAVAHVTVNRVHSKKFPNTVCEVVTQARYSNWWKETHGRNVPLRNQCSFSWYCDGKSDQVYNQQAWQSSLSIARSVLMKHTQDPTNGATYYYNPTLADPYWKDHFQQVASVDNHVFLR